VPSDEDDDHGKETSEQAEWMACHTKGSTENCRGGYNPMPGSTSLEGGLGPESRENILAYRWETKEKLSI